MPIENFSREAAQAHADSVKAFWARKGYKVNTFVVPITEEKKRAGTKATLSGWRFETDMVSGLPKELYEAKLNAEKAK